MHIVTRNDIILLSKPNIFQLVYQFLSKPVVTTTSPPKFHRTLCTTHTPSPFTAWPLLDCPKDHEGHWQRRGQRIDWDSKNNHRPEGIPWQRCQLLRAEKPCGRNDHKGHVIKKRGNHVSQRYLGWGYVTIPRKVLIFDHIRILHAYSPLIYCSDSGRSIYIYILYTVCTSTSLQIPDRFHYHLLKRSRKLPDSQREVSSCAWTPGPFSDWSKRLVAEWAHSQKLQRQSLWTIGKIDSAKQMWNMIRKHFQQIGTQQYNYNININIILESITYPLRFLTLTTKNNDHLL